jgi:hypothetical protein
MSLVLVSVAYRYQRGSSEAVLSSSTARELLKQIGRGASHIQDMCAVARAVQDDGLESQPVADLASLGSRGTRSSNEERDLQVSRGRIWTGPCPIPDMGRC